jgi:5-methylcytosine-specific restriction protein A
MLQPGEIIDNATLCDLFAVANSGGMRRSLMRNHLVIVADWTKRGVQNRWEGDVLHYTGQGKGDQRMEKQNRNLARSAVSGEALLLFEVHEPGRYVYRGRAELAGDPYQEQQHDADMGTRAVWMFPLRLSTTGAADDHPVTPAPRPPAAVHLPAGVYAVVRGAIDAGKLDAVNAALDQLKALGVDVVDRRDVDDARHQRALGRWHERVTAYMRRAARQMVSDLRERRDREHGQWAFAPDEVEIDDHANEDRIRQVLDVIGFGDQLDRLRREAYDAVPQPEPSAAVVDGDAPLSHADVAEIRAAAGRLIR